MDKRNRRQQLATATFAVLVIALLVAGGLYVRTLIADSFTVSNRLADARALDYNALRFMLDEETGLRGFAATGAEDFLAPYLLAKPQLRPAVEQLIAALPGLGIESASIAANDMLLVGGLYVDEVAGPLEHGHLSPARELAVERQGKRRVDRFRQDVRHINTIVTDRTAVVNAEVRSAIDRIGILVGAAVVLTLGISFFYTRQQGILAARVEAARARSRRAT